MGAKVSLTVFHPSDAFRYTSIDHAEASIAPILAAEVAVDHLRGSLIMSWQLFDAL